MNRGDVVLVDWPYSDRTGSKLRPAVVIQADFLNELIDDTVLVQITTKKHGLAEVEIDPAQETLSGLLHISYLTGMNLLTIDQVLVVRALGVLSAETLDKINACLKLALQLP
jgi:mRNA interferase MazF